MKDPQKHDHDEAHEHKGDKPAAISFDDLLARAAKAKPEAEGPKKFDPEKEGVEMPGDNDKALEA